MTAEQQIRQLFKQHKDLTVVQIIQQTKVAKQSVHRILKKLSEEGTIQKIGLPLKTVYRQ
jgi:DNA-binding MarR family transcriptional regulator